MKFDNDYDVILWVITVIEHQVMEINDLANIFQT